MKKRIAAAVTTAFVAVTISAGPAAAAHSNWIDYIKPSYFVCKNFPVFC